MKNHPLLTKTVVAIVAITILATTAIIKEIDTGIVTSCIAAITGLGGFFAGRLTKPK